MTCAEYARWSKSKNENIKTEALDVIINHANQLIFALYL